MGHAFKTGGQVIHIIYNMSDTEINRVISSFIKEKVFLIYMVQLLSPKISTIKLSRSLVSVVPPGLAALDP